MKPPKDWHAFIGTLLLATAVTLFVIAAGIVYRLSTDEPTGKHTPAPEQQLEPYGGCDEAYLYPDTEGARWCAERGLP